LKIALKLNSVFFAILLILINSKTVIDFIRIKSINVHKKFKKLNNILFKYSLNLLVSVRLYRKNG